MFLGIDKITGIIYESGSTPSGARALLSSPNLFDLYIEETPEEALRKLKDNPSIFDKFLYREDSFDPVAMVRRGRVYKSYRSQPQDCVVFPANEIPNSRSSYGVVKKSLFCYQEYLLTSWNPSQQLFAIIGSDKAYSVWRIVSVDRMYLNEELITLRPLYFLGALPDLSPNNIPEQWRTKVIESVQKVVDSMYKANADSIIELCRHAASASLFAEFHEDIPQVNQKDLGKLANMAEQKKRRIISHCGKTITDLHSRLKPNIQMHHNCRPASERDAELAIQCLSLILRDLGYTRSS